MVLRRTLPTKGGSRRVAKCLQESILIAFDFILKVLPKVLLSDRIFATLLDVPLPTFNRCFNNNQRQLSHQ